MQVVANKTKEQVIMEGYSFPSGSALSVTLRNVGSASVMLASADYFINGAQATPSGVCVLLLLSHQRSLAQST